MKTICVIGTQGAATSVAGILHALGRFDELECFMEPDHLMRNELVFGLPIKPMSVFDPSKNKAVVAVGNGVIREKVVKEQLPPETEYETLIHPLAYISPWCEIGRGAVIDAGVKILHQTTIGQLSFINVNAAVGNNVEAGDYFTVAPGATIAGPIKIGDRVAISMGANINNLISICDDVHVGMGAVVLRDIVESGVYVGSPVRKIR